MVSNMTSTLPPDFIPGTVHLVDLNGNLHSPHTRGAKDVMLVPAPSDDPDDPLNWSRGRKALFLFCISVYCLAIGIASAAIYSILVPISDATQLSVADLNSGTGYMFLAFGWGCLFWQPMAQKFGKRPVYLFSLLSTMGIMLWAPHTTSNGQWIANKVLQGFLGAPIESLCEISISDVYFTHERGTYMAFYGVFLFGSNYFAPVIAGFINDGQGWKWVLHWCSIFCGAAFLICILFMEETNYQRTPLLTTTPEETDLEKSPVTNSDQTSKKEGLQDATGSDVSCGQMETRSNKSFVQRMKLIRHEDLHGNVPLKGMLLRPFIYFSFPVVVFSGFMYGSILCYFNVLNGTTSLILSASPYNFSASIVGLSYMSCVIGVLIGTYYSGPLSDKFILWKAKRNNGVMEPEHRLWLYTVLLVTVPGGLLLWGVGAAHEVHWFGPVFAMGVLGASITIGGLLPISYCIDSYKDLGADAIVTVILIRNTMGFAVSYGITPWVENLGYQDAFLVAAFTALAQLATFFIFIKWGRQMRQSSVQRYWKYVQWVKEDGLLH